MALTNDEQRTLDEIERALRDDDPTFVNAVNLDHLRHHRKIVSALAFLVGLILLMAGEIASQAQLAVGIAIGVAGFTVMFAAIAWKVRAGSRR